MTKAEYLKNRAAGLRVKGKCATCGKSRTLGTYRCLVCQQKHREQQRRYRMFGSAEPILEISKRKAIENCRTELAKRVLMNYFNRGCA